MSGRKATGVWTFQDREHEITTSYKDDKLTIEVQDLETVDQWRASFVPKQIEDLTRKTGNFKHITVFVNMLESAVLKSSDSVTLELLTYADLENLRQRRNHLLTTKTSPSSTAQSKRYLILTYSSEFDRIHYPLALPYVGKPDPVELQETIRCLQEELEKYKNKTNHRTSSSFVRLQKKYDTLLAEKEELESALEEIQQEMAEGVLEVRGEKDTTTLRNVIRQLEEDLLKERTKYQRTLSKKNEEIRALTSEIEELRSSERLLNTRVKSLTNELAMMRRRSPAMMRAHSNRNNCARAGCSKREGVHSSPSSSQGHLRNRTSSVENHASGGNHRTRNTGTLRSHSRTPSPRGRRGSNDFQRFDPTAYVQNKRRTQNDVNSHLRRTHSRSSSAGSIGVCPPRPSPSSYLTQSRRINLGTRSRSSSVGSHCSRGSSRRSSSLESLTEGGYSSYGRGASRPINSNRDSSLKRKPVSSHTSRQINSSTPKVKKGRSNNKRRHNDSSRMDHSIEIKEIDARLNALQQYMKKSLEQSSR